MMERIIRAALCVLSKQKGALHETMEVNGKFQTFCEILKQNMQKDNVISGVIVTDSYPAMENPSSHL